MLVRFSYATKIICKFIAASPPAAHSKNKTTLYRRTSTAKHVFSTKAATK